MAPGVRMDPGIRSSRSVQMAKRFPFCFSYAQMRRIIRFLLAVFSTHMILLYHKTAPAKEQRADRETVFELAGGDNFAQIGEFQKRDSDPDLLVISYCPLKTLIISYSTGIYFCRSEPF